jgi:hypothetical protein
MAELERRSEILNGFDRNNPDARMLMRFAAWHQEATDLAALDPRLASGMEKVAEGIREAQTALVTYSPTAPTSYGLMPRLEIHIPMPAGVAAPARAPRTQQPIPSAEPAQPAAAQSR